MTHYYTVAVIADPTNITLPASKTLNIQETITLKPTITPSDATATLTWSSSDTGVATVSSTGDITGISAGTTDITVTTHNGLSAKCTVTIEDTPPLPDPSSSWLQGGNYDITWFTNNKTEYTISTNKQLAGMAYLVTNGYSNFAGTTIYLANDIDLGSNYWLAAGVSETNCFKGIFDGQEHTISNFYPKEYDGTMKNSYVGLFGYVSGGAIKNLTVKGKINIEKTAKGTISYIGGLVGYAYNVNIDHCKSIIDINYSYLPKGSGSELFIGGILGYDKGTKGIIRYCSHIGSICISHEEGIWHAPYPTFGGLAGKFGGNMEFCDNISSELSYYRQNNINHGSGYEVYCGGLVGYLSESIKYCRSIVNTFNIQDLTTLSHGAGYIGGISGYIYKTCINCYSIVNTVNLNYAYPGTEKWGDIIAVEKDGNKANYSNSDVVINSNVELQKYYYGSLAFNAEQMKTSSFLDELNMYSLQETGKGAWKQGEDGYPVIAELYPSPTTPVSSISLNESKVTLMVGGTSKLTATVLPENASEKSVSWTSSNEGVATVDDNGLITAVAEGSATITCTANDGSGVSATCTVTVQSSTVYVSSITLNATEKDLMIDDEPFQLVATILPSNATNKSVTWTSSNESVATVSSNGLVTAYGEGNTTITCKANDGSGVSATCTVTVASDPVADVYFVSVTCDNKNLNQLTQKDELVFHATFGNYGDTDYIYTCLAILDKGITRVCASGEEDGREFPAGKETKVDYTYALDTVPEGNYYATVLFYDWNSEYWIYDDPYLFEITIKSRAGGDVNGDGQVNGTDLVALTNIILGRNAKTSGADVNGDGQVNGTDYVALTNIILGKSKAPKRQITTAPKAVPEALQKRLKDINLMQQPIKKIER